MGVFLLLHVLLTTWPPPVKEGHCSPVSCESSLLSTSTMCYSGIYECMYVLYVHGVCVYSVFHSMCVHSVCVLCIVHNIGSYRHDSLCYVCSRCLNVVVELEHRR